MADWKERLNIVYSTNPDFNYETEENDEAEILPKNQQKLRVRIEKHGRGGKTVTIVDGFVGTQDDLKQLAKTLKTACGVGGNAKDNLIIIQGEQKEKVVEILKRNGYTNSK